MAPMGEGRSRAAFWQGFHHAWEYNHRLNRFGSYVRTQPGQDAHPQIVVGHTAASGTGNDWAHFTEFATEVLSDHSVAFQTGVAETVLECQRGDLTPFVARVNDLDLAPELRHREVYTVVLNGFDLYADQFSEKIITFDLEVTEPAVTSDKTKIRFHLLGNLQFDCRSPECQLLPMRIETERYPRRGRLLRRHRAGEETIPPADPARCPIPPPPWRECLSHPGSAASTGARSTEPRTGSSARYNS
jgi:hypothetical protein